MSNFKKYLLSTKDKILKEFEKNLERELSNSNNGLKLQILELQKSLKSKQSQLLHQKQAIEEMLKKQLSTQQLEEQKNYYINEIWQASTSHYLKNHKDLWYQSIINKIPQTTGTLKYNSKYTEKTIISQITASHPKLKLESIETIQDGFVFESNTQLVDLTFETYQSEEYLKLRPVINQLLNKNNLL